MEASFNRLCSLALQNTRQLPSRRRYPLPPRSFRAIYTTPIYRRQRPIDEPPPPPSEITFNYDELCHEDRREYDRLSPEDKAIYRDDYIALEKHMSSPKIQELLETEVANAAYDIQQEVPRGPDRKNLTKKPYGLLPLGEDEQDMVPDELYRGDDITSLAHGELEQHREKREYARIAAWEMPMLSSTSQTMLTRPRGIASRGGGRDSTVN